MQVTQYVFETVWSLREEIVEKKRPSDDLELM